MMDEATEKLLDERHQMLLTSIADVKGDLQDKTERIEQLVEKTCTALTDHAKIDDTRYGEFQKVQQTLGMYQKMSHIGGTALLALFGKEGWNFFKH